MDIFGDDVIYDIADICDGVDPGVLKHAGVFVYLKDSQDSLEKYNTDHSAPDRYFRRARALQVYQKRLNPPCYEIWPSFLGVKRLINDLDLPTNPKEMFFSKLIAGGDYAWAVNGNYGRYQNYAVEVFGLEMSGILLNETCKRKKLPDPRQYTTPPKYWFESPMELIQIWRTRVFRSCSFTPSTANPLTPYRPNFPYLEKRWHPNVADATFTLAGIEENSLAPAPLKRFYTDAYKILTSSRSRPGRPRGSGCYKNRQEFFKEVRDIYRKFVAQFGRRPLQKEVIVRMPVSVSSFKRYWSQTKLRWNKVHNIFNSESLEISSNWP